MHTADGLPAGQNDDADARFAAYLADVAANVNDPTWGSVNQMILNDDPEQQRALFDLGEAWATDPAPLAPSPLTTVTMILTMLLTGVAFIVARHLS